MLFVQLKLFPLFNWWNYPRFTVQLIKIENVSHRFEEVEPKQIVTINFIRVLNWIAIFFCCSYFFTHQIPKRIIEYQFEKYTIFHFVYFILAIFSNVWSFFLSPNQLFHIYGNWNEISYTENTKYKKKNIEKSLKQKSPVGILRLANNAVHIIIFM